MSFRPLHEIQRRLIPLFNKYISMLVEQFVSTSKLGDGRPKKFGAELGTEFADVPGDSDPLIVFQLIEIRHAKML